MWGEKLVGMRGRQKTKEEEVLAQTGDYKDFTKDGLIKIRTNNFEGFTEDKYTYNTIFFDDDDHEDESFDGF